MQPRARSDQRRNDGEILAAAARVLAADPGASIQAIADAAGLSRLSVYRRYPDRRALGLGLRRAVDTAMREALDAFPGWSAGAPSLRELLGALAEVVWRYPVVAVLPLLPGPAGEAGGPGAADDADPAYSGSRDAKPPHPAYSVRGDVEPPDPAAVDARVESILAAGQAAQVLSDDVPPAYLNEVVFAMLSSTWRRRSAGGADAAADLIMRVIGPGILSASSRAAP